jgi:purine-binding chemotaxis protein CheW
MQATAPISLSAPPAAAELFGSFHLNGTEFALPAACIREVVNFPAKLTAIPLSPPFLEGVFTLRGLIVPVIHLARIFDPAAAPSNPAFKLAIIDHEGVQLGILFHRTGEVIRVRTDQLSTMTWRNQDRKGVVSGTIQLDDGERLLEILDPAALVSIENVPHIRQLRANSGVLDQKQFRLMAERRCCVCFRAGDTVIGFDMLAIREIINVPELKPSVLAGKLCLGRINFRGSAVAVIDFAALIGRARDISIGDGQQRILICSIGETLIGFLVDAVDTIHHFFDSDVLPIPLLSKSRSGMFAGCITRTDATDILFLDHQAIFSFDELREIGLGHTRLYQQEAQEDAASSANTNKARQTYIVFRLDRVWAIDIRQVREVIDYSADMLRPPGLPACVLGVLNIRQQMVSVIDLLHLYGLDPLPTLTMAKVLIIEQGSERFGLVVDAIETIATIADSARRATPSLARREGSWTNDFSEVIDFTAPEGTTRTLSVFEPDALFARLGEEINAAA